MSILSMTNKHQTINNLPAIGIDLGNVNSCIAFFDSTIETVITLPNEYENCFTRSMVTFTSNKKNGKLTNLIVGNDENIITFNDTNNDKITCDHVCKKTFNSNFFGLKRLTGKEFHCKVVQDEANWLPMKLNHKYGKLKVKVMLLICFQIKKKILSIYRPN